MNVGWANLSGVGFQLFTFQLGDLFEGEGFMTAGADQLETFPFLATVSPLQQYINQGGRRFTIYGVLGSGLQSPIVLIYIISAAGAVYH